MRISITPGKGGRYVSCRGQGSRATRTAVSAPPAGTDTSNSKRRVDVTPAKRGRGCLRPEGEEKTPKQRHQAMSWAQRLKRVFKVDIETCAECGGPTKVIACIEDPVVIKKILDHLNQKPETGESRALPESRAPPFPRT